MDDSFNMDDFSIEYNRAEATATYQYNPVPAYDFIRFEVRITDDFTIEVSVADTRPDYLAITRQVAEG